MEKFGTRLRRLRRARGWDTPRAADIATGIPAATWTNLETRGTKPTLKTVSRLMDALDSSYDELVTGTDAAADDPVPTSPPQEIPPVDRRRNNKPAGRRGT